MNCIINELYMDLYQVLLGYENKKNVKIYMPDRVVKSDYGKLNMAW